MAVFVMLSVGMLNIIMLIVVLLSVQVGGIGQDVLDTKGGKQSCHRCLIDTGVEKMNDI
jgi:hypothetical protein